MHGGETVTYEEVPENVSERSTLGMKKYETNRECILRHIGAVGLTMLKLI